MKPIAFAIDPGQAAPRARSAVGSDAGRAGAFDDLIAGLDADDQATFEASAAADAPAGTLKTIVPGAGLATPATAAKTDAGSNVVQTLGLAPLLAKIIAAPAAGGSIDKATGDRANADDGATQGSPLPDNSTGLPQSGPLTAPPAGLLPPGLLTILATASAAPVPAGRATVATPADGLSAAATPSFPSAKDSPATTPAVTTPAATTPAATTPSATTPAATTLAATTPAATTPAVTAGAFAAGPPPDLGSDPYPDVSATRVSGIVVASYLAPATAAAGAGSSDQPFATFKPAVAPSQVPTTAAAAPLPVPATAAIAPSQVPTIAAAVDAQAPTIAAVAPSPAPTTAAAADALQSVAPVEASAAGGDPVAPVPPAQASPSAPAPVLVQAVSSAKPAAAVSIAAASIVVPGPRSKATDGSPSTPPTTPPSTPRSTPPLPDAPLPPPVSTVRPASAVTREPAAASAGDPAAGPLARGDPAAAPSSDAVEVAGRVTTSDTTDTVTPGATSPKGDAIIGASASGPVRGIADAVVKLAAAPPAAAAVPADPSRPAVIGPARTLTLQLSPGSLGTVSIRLHLAAGALDLKLGVSDPETLGLLNRERDSLVAALHDQATTLHSLTIEAGASPSPGGHDASHQRNATGDEAQSGGSAGRGADDRSSGRRPGRSANPQDAASSAASSPASIDAGDGLFV